MQDPYAMLAATRRPRLLIRAARFGARDYSRNRHLRRLLGYGTLPRPAVAVIRLIDIEKGLDDLRRDGDAGYSLVRHLDVLIALIGEARLLQAHQPAGEPAPASDRPGREMRATDAMVRGPSGHMNASGIEAFFSAT